MDRALIALNIKLVEPVKVSMENAWFIDSEYHYDTDSESRWTYFLANKLFNIKHPITKAQAKILPNERYSESLHQHKPKEVSTTTRLDISTII